MVIVKSKIDFATSMRRIFQSMAGKIFDFQCKRQRKVVKNFHCNQYISFCRKKEEDCEKRTVWKTKGKFSSFQEMGLPAAFGYPMLPIKAFCRRALSRAVLFLQ